MVYNMKNIITFFALVILVSCDSGNEKATTGNSWFGAHTAGDCQLFQHHALGWGGLMLAMLVLACSYAPLRNARLGSVLLRQSPALFFARGPPATL